MTYALIMLGAGLINMFKVPITAALNAFSAWWHMIGVLVIVGILIIVPDHHRSFGYVFGQTINNTGFGGGTTSGFVFFYVFLTGLLMAQYTITGYDASAHMSEETRSASMGAAWGMVMSVVVSVIFGFILLVAVTFVGAERHGRGRRHRTYIISYIWTTSMSKRWAEFLLFIAVVAQMLLHDRVDDLGVADDVRVLARPGGARATSSGSGSRSATASPIYTVWAICVLAFLTPLPALWYGYDGYAASTAVAVIGLYIAFMLPIILRLRAGEKFERGAWHLGRHYKWIDCDRDPLDHLHLRRLHASGASGRRSVERRASTGTSSTTRRSRSARRSCSSAAGTCSRPASGSRARSGRARRRARADRARVRRGRRPRRLRRPVATLSP